jgi:hypothetical protein
MKKLIALIFSLILIAPAFGALYTPLPVGGKIKGSSIPVFVKITNLRTGVSEIFSSNEYDEYLFDWANSNDNGGILIKYQSGDVFEIKIPSCEGSPNCVKKVTYTAGGIIADFDLTGTDNICQECQPCGECQECPDCPSCPVCEVCELCEICEECEVCKDKTVWEMILEFFGILGIGTITIGSGYKFVVRKNLKTGKEEIEVTQHKHKISPSGNDNYHSINTLHTHVNFKHPKGMKDPWNVKGWGTNENPYKEL